MPTKELPESSINNIMIFSVVCVFDLFVNEIGKRKPAITAGCLYYFLKLNVNGMETVEDTGFPLTSAGFHLPLSLMR